MKTFQIAVIFLTLVVFVFPASAQKQKKEKPNSEIVQMLKEISAKNIETTIQKLVSFGTRNTLSEQNNPARGIGAARDYLFAEFQKISADCGNCLAVEKQTFL
ncbi:MAG: peptidase M28, partial [Acidobacteriota bacterium]|nr:peptidase M28 [Acidobacteriota bacterium]